MKIIIAGAGFVGREMFNLFPTSMVYDPYKTRNDVSWAGGYFISKPPDEIFDICFICVNTPMFVGNADSIQVDGSCDTSAVENVINTIKAKTYCIRSTVSPGFTQRIAETIEYRFPDWGIPNKEEIHSKVNYVFSPEYVASDSPYPAPLGNVKERTFYILGGEPTGVKNIRRLLETVYPPTCDIMETDSTTAEIIKLLENTAIANKVTLCNEFYNICSKWRVDYDTVRKGVFGLDPRFTEYWTYVRESKRGWDGKCLPKDISNLIQSTMELGYDPKFIRSIVENNERHKHGN